MISEIPQSSGFSTFTGNSGEFKFWGHEISIQSRNLVGDFRWTTDFLVTFADNEVVALADNVDALYSGDFPARTISQVGQRIGLFWGLQQDGVYDNQEEYDSSPKAAASGVGTIKFVDINGDGEITNTDLTDRTVIGDPTPKFLFGMTNTFQYKNFDLSVVVSGSMATTLSMHSIRERPTWMACSTSRQTSRTVGVPPENQDLGNTAPQYSTYMERDWFHSRFVEDRQSPDHQEPDPGLQHRTAQ
ncbi:MAG: hypothetical protein R2751_18995 [Bacteroidales bacterium]